MNRETTLRIERQRLLETGRLDAMKLEWREGMPDKPHRFWDSDCAKWVEAAANALMEKRDPELERQIDEYVDLLVAAQEPSGYVNSYFQTVEPEKRWTNLRDAHELYCAGHLMEAAVTYHRATGKRKMLDALCRYADHIDSLFGAAEGKKAAYPGHEEIELALIKLFRATGEARYRELAAFFVNARGQEPNYFVMEAEERGEDPNASSSVLDYYQAHRPVRDQKTAEGHAVRACYLYAGMADVAAETNDDELFEACETLWNNIVQKRVYVTGGIGSGHRGERFTIDYDLPNDTAYAETCAAIALVFFAQRMFHMTGKGEYVDVMETALHNGVLAGVSLAGDRFFYENPLAFNPEKTKYEKWNNRTGEAGRQPWFNCACCPPNLARLLASLGDYAYSRNDDELWVNLFIDGEIELQTDDGRIGLSVRTDYPWEETVLMTIDSAVSREFALNVRMPGWCRKPVVKLNGNPIDAKTSTAHGYLRLRRRWSVGDEIRLTLPMPVERIEARPEVWHDAGKVALRRGPVVHCLEERDNGPNLSDVSLPLDSELRAEPGSSELGGAPVIKGQAARREWDLTGNELYRPISDSSRRNVEITAIPYHMWANRGPGEMIVWINSR